MWSMAVNSRVYQRNVGGINIGEPWSLYVPWSMRNFAGKPIYSVITNSNNISNLSLLWVQKNDKYAVLERHRDWYLDNEMEIRKTKVNNY